MSKSSCYKKDGIVYFRNKDIPRKSKFIDMLGVKKGTFAGNMVSRVYDYYFRGALNIKREYQKFYKREFESPQQFIEEHFNIDDNEAKKLAADNYFMKECYHRAFDGIMETMNYDKSIKEAISDAMGGLEDEDHDGVYYQ